MANARICSIPNCNKRPVARGWCEAHYRRWRQHGDPTKGGPARKTPDPICKIDGCENSTKFGSKGYCRTHYRRWRKYGDPLIGGWPDPSQCAVSGCDRRVTSKGLCNIHYQRLRRHGSELIGRDAVTASGDAQSYFRETVLSYEGDDCLLWPYARDLNGYAQVYWEGRVSRAHRIACTVVHGTPPFPLAEAAHSCGNGHLGCVNPRHLRWDTRTGNQSDRLRHGTHVYGDKHGGSKLGPDDVREIRLLRGQRPLKEIAARFGVSKSTISAIHCRRLWRLLD